MARSTFSGPINATTKETDGEIFIPAKYSSQYTGTWTDTRNVLGDYFMRKTAAVNAGQTVFYLTPHLLQKIGADPATVGNTHDIRGVELVSFDLIFNITVAPLNAHSVSLRETTYANSAAPSPVAVGGALIGAVGTAVSVSPYVSNIALTTTVVLGRSVALRQVYLEIAWDAALTTVLDYYGVNLRVNYNLL